MHVRIRGLPAEQFAPFFSTSDEELAANGAVRRIADARRPGYPCRVSLSDSNPGDELVLLNYEHHAVASPYRMRFAIFVRSGDKTPSIRCRRSFEAARSRSVPSMPRHDDRPRFGRWRGTRIRAADAEAAYLHIHFAAPGCYAAQVDRA
jgi:hypothetical protein